MPPNAVVQEADGTRKSRGKPDHQISLLPAGRCGRSGSGFHSGSGVGGRSIPEPRPVFVGRPLCLAGQPESASDKIAGGTGSRADRVSVVLRSDGSPDDSGSVEFGCHQGLERALNPLG